MYTNWTELETACKACEKCELCQTRTHVVFGMGNPQSDILFIGEGPGENEDLEGLPFVGRSGQLLDKMLAAIDLDRNKNIYIANNAVLQKIVTRFPKSKRLVLIG